jgi:hypothetical protein
MGMGSNYSQSDLIVNRKINRNRTWIFLERPSVVDSALSLEAQMPKPDSTDRFGAWRGDVDKVMVQKFAINTTDAGLSDDELLEHWQQEPSAVAFVEWYGEKYDLTPLADWNWQITGFKT